MQEYLKNSKNHSKIKAHSLVSHTRSKSDDYSYFPHNKKPSSSLQTNKNPTLSYKEFKSVHKALKNTSKVTIPQIFKVSNRKKIMGKFCQLENNLNSAKSELLKNKSEGKNKPEEDQISFQNIFEPGLTYGEKIIKLKALVVSNLF